jgi:hypothetical protein
MEQNRRNSPKNKLSHMEETSRGMRILVTSSLRAREMTCDRKDEGEWFMGEGENPGVVDETHL